MSHAHHRPRTTAAHLWSTTDRVVSAIVSARRAGTLSRERLESAAEHVLAAKHIDLCAG